MRRTFASLCSRLGPLRHDRRGNVAMIFGLALIPMIVAGGMGVDMARAYAVKVRLGGALDAAALAVAGTNPAQFSLAQLQQRLQNYVTANFPASAFGAVSSPTMAYQQNTDNNVINVSATATVPTIFMPIMGINSLTVTVSNQVTRGISGLELALVLDNTLSMTCGDAGDQSQSACAQGTPHIHTLVADTQDIINTLFSQSQDTSKLKVAIVPYVTAVNVGAAFSQNGTLSKYVGSTYLDQYGNKVLDPFGKAVTYDATQAVPTQSNPMTGSTAIYEWKGCVIDLTTANEDKTGIGYDISEPSGGWTGPWPIYYWPPTTTYQGTTTTNGFPTSSPYNGPGSGYTTTTKNGQTTVTLKSISYNTFPGNVAKSDYQSAGPNLACPSSMTRLTNDQSVLNTAVSKIQAWESSGTMIHEGMIWGWRALSPNPPFSDGLPYNTTGWIKAVVLETDGQNDVNDGFLTGLGLPADGKMGVTCSGHCSSGQISTALTTLNNRLATICTNMKNAGIVVYTIGLGSGSDGGAGNTTLAGCAGNGGSFYSAPTAADLTTAFQAIANSLNNLRLSK
jgi:Flp pilus assembly protein TadG